MSKRSRTLKRTVYFVLFLIVLLLIASISVFSVSSDNSKASAFKAGLFAGFRMLVIIALVELVFIGIRATRKKPFSIPIALLIVVMTITVAAVISISLNLSKYKILEGVIGGAIFGYFSLRKKEKQKDELKIDAQREESEKKKKVLDTATRMLYNAESLNQLKETRALFLSIGNYEDARKKAEICLKRMEGIKTEEIYNRAVELMQSTDDEKKILKAQRLFESILDYKDSSKLYEECKNLFEEYRTTETNMIKQKEESNNVEDMITSLERLSDLHNSGSLTDEEFEFLKNKLLG